MNKEQLLAKQATEAGLTPEETVQLAALVAAQAPAAGHPLTQAATSQVGAVIDATPVLINRRDSKMKFGLTDFSKKTGLRYATIEFEHEGNTVRCIHSNLEMPNDVVGVWVKKIAQQEPYDYGDRRTTPTEKEKECDFHSWDTVLPTTREEDFALMQKYGITPIMSSKIG